MRLASHILAVFLAISTIASPCLASIKAGKDASEHRKQAELVALQSQLRVISATLDHKVADICNGPCARLITFRNIQPQRATIIRDSDGLKADFVQFEPKCSAFYTTTPQLASLTNWNNVNIFQLCRQLN